MAAATVTTAAALPREKVQDELFFIVSELSKAFPADGPYVFVIKGGAALALHYINMGSPKMNFKDMFTPIQLPISETPMEFEGMNAQFNVNMPFVSDIDTALYVKGDSEKFDTEAMIDGCNTIFRVLHKTIETSFCTAADTNGSLKPPNIIEIEERAKVVSFDKYLKDWALLTLPSSCPYSIQFKAPHKLFNVKGEHYRTIQGSLLTLLYEGKDVLHIQIPNEIKIDETVPEYTLLKPLLMRLIRLNKTEIIVPVVSFDYTIKDLESMIKKSYGDRQIKRQKRLGKIKAKIGALNAAKEAEARRRAAMSVLPPLPPSPPSPPLPPRRSHGPPLLPPPLPPPRQFDRVIHGKTRITILDKDGRMYLIQINGVKLPLYKYFFYDKSPHDITVVYNFHGVVFEESLLSGLRWKKVSDREYIPVNSSGPLISLRARRSTQRRAQKQRRRTYRRK